MDLYVFFKKCQAVLIFPTPAQECEVLRMWTPGTGLWLAWQEAEAPIFLPLQETKDPGMVSWKNTSRPPGKRVVPMVGGGGGPAGMRHPWLRLGGRKCPLSPSIVHSWAG